MQPSVEESQAAAGSTAVRSRPRRPAFDRETAKRLMTAEYARVVDQLESLSTSQWAAPTCNSGWDVRDLVAHMTGMTAMAASVPEQMRQTRAAKKRHRTGELIDSLTAVQVEKYAGWAPARLVAEYARLAPKAVKGRRRMPGLLRGRTMPGEQAIDPGKVYELWTFSYLVDVILTRDPWMHRSDISIATGTEISLTAEHDGVIVHDVVTEWAQRHGRPCSLVLTGPAGGSWTFGDGGPSYQLDAIEFCRVLSGRGTGEGLLTTRVPF